MPMQAAARQEQPRCYLEPRVEALEETVESGEQDRADLAAKVLTELGALAADRKATVEALGTVAKRLDRIEVLLPASLDKERAHTDSEVAGVARRLKDLRDRCADDKREVLRRLDELDRDVDASGQHGRDTLTSVQVRAERLELENKLAIARQEADNRERIAAEHAERLERELAASKEREALAEARAHDERTWKRRTILLLVGSLLIGLAYLGLKADVKTDAGAPRLPPLPGAAH